MKQKKNKTAHGCLQVLAGLVAIAFIFTAVPCTLIASFSRTFANPENVKSALSMDELLREFMTRSIEKDIQQKYLALNLPPPQLDTATLRRTVDLIVPPNWIDNATNEGIDNIYNFLREGRTDDYVLSYMPLVETLLSESGREAMTIIVAHYPPCPPGQTLLIEYKARNVDIPCLPPDRSVAETADQVYGALIAGLSSDPVILAGGAERLTWPTIDPEVVFYICRAFQVVDQMWLFWLLPLGLLVFVAILAGRSLCSLGIWLGCPLLITGLLAPIAGLGVYVQMRDWLDRFLEQIGPAEDKMGQLLLQFFVDIIASLQTTWLTGVFLQAGPMILLGFGGVLLALYLKLIAQKRQ